MPDAHVEASGNMRLKFKQSNVQLLASSACDVVVYHYLHQKTE